MPLTLKKVDLSKVVAKERTRGAYNEVLDQVLALADTKEGVVVSDIEESELTKQLIPAVRRAVGAKLNRKLIVGTVEGVNGYVLYVGGALEARTPLTDEQKAARKAKRAENKAKREAEKNQAA